MRRAYSIGAATVGALVVAGVAIAATAPGTLSGSVGPGFSISLRDAQGNAVTRAEPGAFQLEVDDKSEEHNFHLRGPGGVDVSTDVAAVGKQTFAVTLVDGRYTFVCDPHATSMRGSFEVGAMVAAAHEAAGVELREVRPFDVYRGEQVGEGRKSVALHLVFQSPERTLTDDEVAVLRDRIVAELAERFDAELRS